jgi:uncharacterized lipoprotein YmbA
MRLALNTDPPEARRSAARKLANLRLGALLPIVLLAMLAAGCAGQPTRYYTLAPAPLQSAETATSSAKTSATTSATSSATSSAIFFELAPVAVPERLARPQMVLTKPGQRSVEVELLERHRWISSFDHELREALATGIAVKAGAIDVTRSGAPSAQAVWRIAVQLRQFEAIEDARVDAIFGWTVRRSDADLGAACRWTGSAAVGSGIDALARGTQQLTEQAAQAIARHLLALAVDPAAPCGS